MQQCYFSAGGKRSFPDSASIELHPPTCFRPAGRRREKRTRVKANGKKVDHQKPQCIPFKPVEKRVCTCVRTCMCVYFVCMCMCACCTRSHMCGTRSKKANDGIVFRGNLRILPARRRLIR